MRRRDGWKTNPTKPVTRQSGLRIREKGQLPLERERRLGIDKLGGGSHVGKAASARSWPDLAIRCARPGTWLGVTAR